MKQVDIIPESKNYTAVNIAEGSVIRVAPAGKRSLCNISDEPMVYICIQSKENSLEEHTTDDGTRVVVEPKWRKQNG